MQRAIVIALFLAPPLTARAQSAECYVNPRTDAHQCVVPTEVRERDSIRSAPLYTGGPNGVRKTPYFVHTNCATGVTHLKDRDGVSFAGGTGNETPAVKKLREIVCDASLPVAKKSKK